jgi:phage terminase Nu1 subunit (DNA packaging protein)
MKPPLYTVTTLAHALDLSQPQVSQWKALGMPFSKSGKISMADAVRWLRDRAAKDRPKIGASEANERRAAAEAQLAELKLALEMGEVTPTGDVRAMAEEEILRFRTAVQQMASSEAPYVAARLNCSHREASAVLREVADRVLSGLAGDDVAEEEAA